MVSIGSKALPLRRAKACNFTEDCFMAREDNSHNHHGRKRSMSRKDNNKRKGFNVDKSSRNSSGGVPGETFKAKNFSNNQEAPVPQTSFLRKQVDPETAKYFLEIANVIEGTEVDLEERSSICGNALEETRGKEVDLATDYIISHTLQALLEGCAVDQLCLFLQNCSKDFPRIAMDRSGSHVAETALKSLAVHLQENETHSLVKETLTKICQAIVVNPVEVMCNCYGSHVLRSLLCLCKGVPLDSTEFHSKKSSTVLAERLNFRPSQVDKNESRKYEHAFPDLLKFLISEMLKAGKKEIATLQVDQFSSLVLQAALKLLAGNEPELLHILPILLGCSTEDAKEGNFIKVSSVQNLLRVMTETAFSHLMEVILEVAPAAIYDELITKVFKGSLFTMSSHHCGNFVVQALISHARSEDHMELIWEELGTKFKDLFGMGRSGVVASLLAACHKLHSHEHKCCQALAAAVCMENDSSRCIIPRILFLDNYFCCKDKSNWNWPNGARMHVMGSLILQSIFRFPSGFIHAYISSITSLEPDNVLEASKDSGSARVIEAFLSSNASGKQKRKLVVKLRGHFGELSVHSSGSFTVEKCFNISSVSLREAIVSEMLAVQTELSKTKQGPHLLRRLDVEGYAKRPEQWKSRQTSKESTYKEYFAAFGPKEPKPLRNDTFLTDTRPKSQQEKLKDMRKEIDTHLASPLPPASGSQFHAQDSSTNKFKKSGVKRHLERAERSTDDTLKSRHKKQKK